MEGRATSLDAEDFISKLDEFVSEHCPGYFCLNKNEKLNNHLKFQFGKAELQHSHLIILVYYFKVTMFNTG